MGTKMTRAEHRNQITATIRDQFGGQIRMAQALKAGITRTILYKFRDEGILEQVSRGVFRLSELPPISNPDIATIALRVPQAVLCLVSALSFHNLTTQIPHMVYIALPRNAVTPHIEVPPLSVHRFSGLAYSSGIEQHETDGINVKVYSPEKTLADCFKFRNFLGMEIVLEALKRYRSQMRLRVDELLKYARICRIERVMTPYLEATL